MRTNLLVVSATLRSEEMIGSEAIKRAYVHSGTNEFAFVVPGDFPMDALIPEKILLVKTDYTCSMEVQVGSMRTPGKAALKAETCHQRGLEEHPGAKILEEFTETAAGRSGPAFDLQVPNGSGMVQFVRVVFIPSAAGVIDSTLLSNLAEANDGQYAYSSILLTLCSNQDGQLTIVPLSDKS